MTAPGTVRDARYIRRLIRWVVDEINSRDTPRACAVSPEDVASAVIAKHSHEIYRDQKLAQLLTKQGLVPYAQTVLSRYFDPAIEVEAEFDFLLSAVNETLAAGHEPSEQLWAAFKAAGKRLLAHAKKKHDTADAVRPASAAGSPGARE
ncbi:MAG: hypothetical protein JO069_13215 [Verrucomicrobia bacterium]|nr:hypothetical protein [Verrucomicrobiota bacterium]